MINHVGMVKQISYFQILDKTLADKSILPEQCFSTRYQGNLGLLSDPSRVLPDF